jgi:hypothetical protein
VRSSISDSFLRSLFHLDFMEANIQLAAEIGEQRIAEGTKKQYSTKITHFKTF